MSFNILKKHCFTADKDRDSSHITNGTLCINCRGCGDYYEGTSPECISCICEKIAENGTAERIILQSGKDLEISGDAAEIINRLATVNRPLIEVPRGRNCTRCMHNPETLISLAWAKFPDVDIDYAVNVLNQYSGSDPECISCIQRTKNSIRHAEEEMDSLRSDVKEIMGYTEASL